MLVDLLPICLTLTTDKNVSEESASLQANRLISAAHHSMLRSGYLSVAVGHLPKGCCLACDLEGNVWGVPAIQGHEVCAQLTHSNANRQLYLYSYWGRRRKSRKYQLPKHLPSHPQVPRAVCISCLIN